MLSCLQKSIARLSWFGLCGVLLLCLSGTAFANLSLYAPETVAQGSALRVRAATTEPVTAISFSWMGKSVLASTLPTGDSWEAEALFPVPVDAVAAQVVQAQAGKNRAQATVRLLKVTWPEQQISVDKKYVSPPKSVMARIAADRKKSGAVLHRVSPERYWDADFHRPVPGTVTSSFGGKRMFNGQMRSYHKGVDLRGAQGTPILALTNGTVAIAEDMYFSGNVVYLDHGQGVVSIYAHLSAFSVKPGDTVTAGQEIGLVGATGRVTGPHLHLGLSILGQSVNPLSLVGD